MSLNYWSKGPDWFWRPQRWFSFRYLCSLNDLKSLFFSKKLPDLDDFIPPGTKMIKNGAFLWILSLNFYWYLTLFNFFEYWWIKPPECATSFSKNLRSISVGHFGLQSAALWVETPCTVTAVLSELKDYLLHFSLR